MAKKPVDDEWEDVAPAAAPAAAPASGDEWEDVTTPTSAPAAPVSTSRALARGVRDGVSLEWADEAKGAWNALFGKGGTWKERYAEARDADRAETAQIKDAAPIPYGVGNFGGAVATSFAPGLRAGKGATAGQRAVQAGKTAAVAGAGASEAETTEGVLVDAGVSGLLGAGTAGVLDRVIRAAPERQVQRLVGDVTDGVRKNVRDKLVGKRGANVDDVAREIQARPDFEQVAKSSSKAAHAKADAIRREVGEEASSVYDQIDSSGALGVPKQEIKRAVGSMISQMKGDPATKPARAMLERVIRNIDSEWQGRHVPLGDVRRYITSVQEVGFGGNILNPNASQKLQRELAGRVKDVLDKRFDEIAATAKNLRAAPSVGSRPGFAPLTSLDEPAEKIAGLNKRYSTWANITKSLDEKATREATESTRLKDRISGGVDIGLALAEPTAFVAKKAYDFVGKPLLRKGDDMLATLVTAAENGSTAAQIAERAITLGASPVVANALGSWAVRIARELEGQE